MMTMIADIQRRIRELDQMILQLGRIIHDCAPASPRTLANLRCLQKLRNQMFAELHEALERVEPLAMIYLRTLVAEAERTGSWTVSPDLQERISFLVKGSVTR